MDKRVRSIVGGVVVGLGLFGVACHGAPATDSLTMVTVPNYCPYEFIDQDGEIVGFDIDVARAIASEMGRNEPSIAAVKHFNQIMPLLRQNQADFAMAAITPTPDRQKILAFSQIYYVQKMAIISLKKNDFQTLEHLINKRVGVRVDSYHADTLRQYSAINLELFGQSEALITAVKRQKIDAAVFDAGVAPKYITAASQLTWHLVEPLADVAGVAIAFPSETSLVPDVNRAIAALQTNGVLTQLIHRWFDQYHCPMTEQNN